MLYLKRFKKFDSADKVLFSVSVEKFVCLSCNKFFELTSPKFASCTGCGSKDIKFLNKYKKFTF